MNAKVQIFSNPEFGDVRTLQVNGQPYFVANDVCAALGYAKPRNAVAQHVDNEDALKQGVPDNQGFTQETTLINESGVYSLVFGSKLPSAKFFKRWVTGEVLPSIRQNGGYLATTQEDTPELIMARALQVAQMTIERHQQQLQDAQTTIAEQSKELEAAKPAVVFTTTVQGAKTSILIGELAKLITQSGRPIGQNRLFKWLRDNGYLGKKGSNYNVPMQKYVEMGLFEIKEGTRSGNDGVMHITKTPKVTGKGQVYFVNKFVA